MELNRNEITKIKSLARKKAAIFTLMPFSILTLILFILSNGFVPLTMSVFAEIILCFLAFIGFYNLYFNEEIERHYIQLEDEFIPVDDLTPVVPLKNSIFFRDFLKRVKFYAQKNKYGDTYIFIIYNNEDIPILFDVLCSGNFFSEYELVNQNN